MGEESPFARGSTLWSWWRTKQNFCVAKVAPEVCSYWMHDRGNGGHL